MREVRSNVAKIHSANEWVELLGQLDHQVNEGETTAVVIDLRPYGIAGASVGDSRAWILDDGDVIDLTARQHRKPLLGSGNARPVAFIGPSLTGLLLVATDGFFDYVKRNEIARLVHQTEFYEISRKCIESVRLPSGDLWDDVSVVVARNKPPHRTRQKYSI